MIARTRELVRQLRTDISADLQEQRDELMAPFLEMDGVEFDPDRMEIELAPAGSEYRRLVDLLVGYGYAVRYRDPRAGAPLFPPMVPSNIVWAVTQRFEGRKVVVGSGRVRWQDIEVLDLFDLLPPARWPHEELGEEFGEIAKFAVHPAIDGLLHLPDPELRAIAARYRVVMWQRLGEVFDRALSAQGFSHLYFLASPHIVGWLERAGYSGTRIEAAVPSRSEAVRRMREQWWRYFLPHEPLDRQPHAFYRPIRTHAAAGASGCQPELVGSRRDR